jgi:hypothetical protein
MVVDVVSRADELPGQVLASQFIGRGPIEIDRLVAVEARSDRHEVKAIRQARDGETVGVMERSAVRMDRHELAPELGILRVGDIEEHDARRGGGHFVIDGVVAGEPADGLLTRIGEHTGGIALGEQVARGVHRQGHDCAYPLHAARMLVGVRRG